MAESSERCPKCRQIMPRPYVVQYGNGKKTVSYQCDNCGKAWQRTEDTNPVTQPVSRDQ